MSRLRKLSPAALLLLALPLLAQNNTVVLKRAWVDHYKDRATIDAGFFVDHAHKRPNQPAADGDMHVAGRAPREVGLPMVAEVMNAAQPGQAAAVAEIHALEGKNQQAPVSGAWRFWFEHPAKRQVQFDDVPVAKNTNPDHSFEIHPISKFDRNGISGSFQPIPGFQPYDADKAFGLYEKLKVTVSANSSAISISAAKAMYNYAKFEITLLGSPKKLDDGGYAVLANVNGAADEAIASKVRMIFVPGTPPLQQLLTKKMGDGDTMRVIGIPRINLNAIETFATASGGKSLTRKLPYEMIIAAVAK